MFLCNDDRSEWKGPAYQHVKYPWPLLLCLLMFASRIIFLSMSLSVSLWPDSVSRGPSIRLLSLCNQALHSWAEQYPSSRPTRCPRPSLVTPFIGHTSYSFLHSFCSVFCVSLRCLSATTSSESHCILHSFLHFVWNRMPEGIQDWSISAASSTFVWSAAVTHFPTTLFLQILFVWSINGWILKYYASPLPRQIIYPISFYPSSPLISLYLHLLIYSSAFPSNCLFCSSSLSLLFLQPSNRPICSVWLIQLAPPSPPLLPHPPCSSNITHHHFVFPAQINNS